MHTSRDRSLWNRLLAKKWAQLKAERFVADACDDSDDDDHRSEDVAKSSVYPLTEKLPSDTLYNDYMIDAQQLRLFVGTWNVAGKLPPDDLAIHDWLGCQEPADIYVVGFQEIVPLNPGNVLGSEDGVSASKWDALIRETLNNSGVRKLARTRSTSAPPSPLHDLLLRPEEISCIDVQARHSFADEDNAFIETSSTNNSRISAVKPRQAYVRIASKQMVGIFVSIWMKRELRRHVKAVKVSTVGCGIMGCLGNKGSISVSLSVHQTNFCFICCHLKPGDKEADALRRNSDVSEIIRRTRFPRSKKLAERNLPETILAHDRIIWFGDLNYRLSLPCDQLKSLVAKKDWAALLKTDQLKLEQGAGRVFEGWREGTIAFPPTYKYITNSDVYAVVHTKEGGKKRAPAWCDRILWYGKGLKELSYVRTESRLSDHRPVKAVFVAEVEILKTRLLSNLLPFSKTRVEVHEVFPVNRAKRPQIIDNFTAGEVYNVRTAGGCNTTVKIRKLTPFPLVCAEHCVDKSYLDSFPKVEEQKV